MWSFVTSFLTLSLFSGFVYVLAHVTTLFFFLFGWVMWYLCAISQVVPTSGHHEKCCYEYLFTFLFELVFHSTGSIFKSEEQGSKSMFRYTYWIFNLGGNTILCFFPKINEGFCFSTSLPHAWCLSFSFLFWSVNQSGTWL